MGTLAFGADFTQVCRAGMGSLEDKDRQVLRKSVAKAKHRGIKEGMEGKGALEGNQSRKEEGLVGKSTGKKI